MHHQEGGKGASPVNWRLIDTGPLSGPENMAVDEALLDCYNPDSSAPLLRLYGWQPPALSLGRFQDAAAVLDLDRCRADQLQVVRRITGGGVIYHAEELTYAIVCSPHHLPHAATVKESFRILTAFLLRFYRCLGLNAAYAVDITPDSSRLGERTPFCFAGKESFDIMLDARKIGGNAQRRLKNAIFQHGSIPLRNMVHAGVTYLRESPVDIGAAVAALADFKVAMGTDELKDMLAKAFSAAMATEVAKSALTKKEREAADSLLRSRYGSDSWNLYGEAL
jgi:lipoate-protein ligase A